MKVGYVEFVRELGTPVKGCPSHLFSNRREKARHWTNKFKLLGHQNESANHFVNTLSSSGPSVTSVWGIAGIGKSSVITSVYFHRMLGLGQHLKRGDRGYVVVQSSLDFTMYLWAYVPHPFNLTDLSWGLIRDFYSDDLHAKSTTAISIMEGQDPIQECRRFLREHRCLVVIDGLRSKDDWDLIEAAFIPDSTKSCIVVITNESSVARYCVHDKEHQVVNVKGLEADMALNLFQEIATCAKDFNANDMELLKLIMAKCGGIPRIIAAVAEKIAADVRIFGTSGTTFWLKSTNDYFMGWVETNAIFHSLRGLFLWMQSYFDACSDSLKPCIFYLSVFPAGHNIKKRRLLRRWVAECYSRDTSSGTAEENGEKLMYELVNLSIIQHKVGNAHCQVNGFFHEYIISRPMEDNLVFTLEGNCSLNSQHVGQHLTIMNSWDRDIIVFTSMDLSRLRSLTVFGKWMPFFISTDMRLLRVLDLTDTTHATNDDLGQIGKVMPRLKFLSVRGCKKITHLPESLCGLSQLQTLDVRNTSIVTVPPAIIKLKKLQYVRAGITILSDEYDDTGMTCVPLEDSDCTASDDGVITFLEDCDVTTSDEEQTSKPLEDSDGTASDVEQTSKPLEDSDGTASDVEQTSTPLEDSDGTASDGEQTSKPLEDSDATASDIEQTSTPLEDSDGIEQTSKPLEDSDGMASDVERTSAPLENGDGTASEIEQTTTLPEQTADVQTSALSASCMPRSSVSRWLSKLYRMRKHYNGGVKVPSGIGKLVALHILGVVDVNVAGGKAILKELSKLTQLRKLGVSGINRENSHDLCSAISGHAHLESLSMRLDKDKEGLFFRLDDITQPPKTLKSLKLYGDAQILPSWVMHHENLKKGNLEMHALRQEDLDVIETLRCGDVFSRLCVKPIQDAMLRVCKREDGSPHHGFSPEKQFRIRVLEIDCTTRLEINFGKRVEMHVELLKVCCSSGSSLRVSGLMYLLGLKEVWLKGSYGDELKQDLQRQIDMFKLETVLKVQEPRSS